MALESSPAEFRRILVPTDFSSGSEQAWEVARQLAGRLGAEIVLLHVLVEAPLYSEGPFTMEHARDVFKAARGWAENMLGEWTTKAAARGLEARWLVATGVPHEEIVDAATRERADLIVLGTHGRGGLDRALLGSVADRVIRRAPCPVLSVRKRD
jgi:nucleotide-binding universal stress UspA family protein